MDHGKAELNDKPEDLKGFKGAPGAAIPGEKRGYPHYVRDAFKNKQEKSALQNLFINKRDPPFAPSCPPLGDGAHGDEPTLVTGNTSLSQRGDPTAAGVMPLRASEHPT